ncbi:MAG: dockerin type I repeat-containing protein [Dethiobacter sp.]|jgi:hypothetical protein|nr:dockerin type I repeat-containing protein [Dethiobacter sp.]
MLNFLTKPLRLKKMISDLNIIVLTLMIFFAGIPAPMGVVLAKEGPPPPVLGAMIAHDWIQGHNFPADVTLSVKVNGGGKGTKQVTTDEHGNFFLNEWSDGDPARRLMPGDVITASFDDQTAAMTVQNFQVTDIDHAGDTISGFALAPDGTPLEGWQVQAEIHNRDNWDHLATATGTTGSDGSFTLDLSPFDLLPGHAIFMILNHPDGNRTMIEPYNVLPHFNVNPQGNHIWGHQWPAGVQLNISIDDPDIPGSPNYSTTAVTTAWGDFDLHNLGFDIQAGAVVTVETGQLVKSHEVSPLQVMVVDAAADTVSGEAEPGTQVRVGIHDAEQFRFAQADGSGHWTADFSVSVGPEPWQQAYNIEPGIDGYARQRDNDGDATHIHWQAINPVFRVDPQEGNIWGHQWPSGVELTVTVRDSGVTVFEETTYADPWGDFNAHTGGGVIQTGYLVTVSDGETVKSHYVTAVRITDVNAADSTVYGTAAPNSEVRVDIYAPDGTSRSVQADGSGNWIADFSLPGSEPWEVIYPFVPGTEGAVWQGDDDGDETRIHWRVINPVFNVNPWDNGIWGHEWPAEAPLTITVKAGENEILSGTTQADQYGDFHFWDFTDTNILAGHVVTVYDGITTKEHTVTPLSFTHANPENNTVSGIAAPFSWVRVGIHNNDISRYVQTDIFGNWTADFSSGEQTYDIVNDSEGYARQDDADGDATHINWRVIIPQFWVRPDTNTIRGFNWNAGTTVTITINGGTAYSGTAEVGAEGNFMHVASHDIQAGDMVEVSDGVTTKEHIVTSLVVTDVDREGHTVSGTAEAGSWVVVWLFGRTPEQGNFIIEKLDVEAVGGNWFADFGALGHEIDNREIHVAQIDDDGDATAFVSFVPPHPFFSVNPQDNSIWGQEWLPGASLDINVFIPADPDNPVFSDNTSTDNWGNFHLDNISFEITAGMNVTVTDGVTTKEHTVTPLQVTGTNSVNNTVSGSAAAGSKVIAAIMDFGPFGPQFIHVMDVFANVAGEWTADFGAAGHSINTGGIVWQEDHDGDATTIGWKVFNPAISVNPQDNNIWGDDWPAGKTLNITIFDPSTPDNPDFTGSTITDEWGNFHLMGIAFDIAAGHVVTVTDGEFTRVHIVRPLTVTVVDPDNDTVSGTAEPHSTVNVALMQFGPDGPQFIHILEDIPVNAAGEWTADFGAAGYSIDSGGIAWQHDDEGDSTTIGWSVQSEGVLPGDVNGDGVVNVGDAILVLRHVVNLITLNETQLAAADVNNDGVVDIADVILILRQIAGLDGPQ